MVYKLSQLRLAHPIRLDNKSSLTSLTLPNNGFTLSLLFLPKNARNTSSYSLIPGINLQASHMCIFSILMILHDFDLHKKCAESLPIFATSNMFEWDVDPTFRLRELESRERDQIVVASSCKKSDASWGVGFISFKIEEYAD